MANFKAIDRCRVSGSKNLVSVLDLGEQVLTGVFPASKDEFVESGPLELLWCPDSHLVQLRHSFEPTKMYGDNYGYRSGLNGSMVRHLQQKVRALEGMMDLRDGDIVLDIGSNDATTLKSYANPKLKRLGIDPTGKKFQEYYPKNVALVPDFFSADAYHSVHKEPAKIITSIAMFYDLEDPVGFAKQIASVLADDGVWHFEQSYLPSMLRATSYDTMCHEHIEYYSLAAVEHILAEAGMAVVDVRLNDINGGSFAVTAARAGTARTKGNLPEVEWMKEEEDRMGLATRKPYDDFKDNAFSQRDALVSLVRKLNADGKKVFGYGASTKGNVTLQFCGFGPDDLVAISEVNPDKFGHVTPGSHIPIISEADAMAMKPDYYLVLPWHFRNNILSREQEFINDGGKFIFPFPHIEIV